MLAASSAYHRSCSPRLCTANCVFPCSERRSRRRVACRAANHSTAGAGVPGITAVLQTYGDHAKAAYVMFGQFCDNGQKPTDVTGKGLHAIVADGNKDDPTEALGPLPGLEGFTGVANIMGYPGRAGVFTVPRPIIDKGLIRLAAVEQPSYLGYIAERPGQDGVPELVIAFRGSSSAWADWETNLLGAVGTKGLYGDSDGLVHRGFFNLIHETPDDAPVDINPAKTIQSVLDRYKDTPTDKLPRIITTGHSLGGALAIVAAVFIAHWIPGYCEGSADYTSRKLQTYTFAAPRIGDENLSEYLSSTLNYKAVQVKNQPDVVPYVPPAGLRELRSTLKKLIGMRPKLHTSKGGDMTTATAGDARSEQVMLSGMQTWEEYNELLDELELKSTDPVEQVQELEQYISNKKQQYKTERSTGADVSSAATDNLWRKIQYARRLLTTVATNWSDNPAPDKGQYILDVRDFGRWGGQNHSLEVYCNNLKSYKDE